MITKTKELCKHRITKSLIFRVTNILRCIAKRCEGANQMARKYVLCMLINIFSSPFDLVSCFARHKLSRYSEKGYQHMHTICPFYFKEQLEWQIKIIAISHNFSFSFLKAKGNIILFRYYPKFLILSDIFILVLRALGDRHWVL